MIVRTKKRLILYRDYKMSIISIDT